METLIYAQTVFYIVSSIAIVVIGLMFFIVAYNFIRISEHIQKISENLDRATGDAADQLREVFEKLSAFPILSFFLKKAVKHSKSRRENHSDK